MKQIALFDLDHTITSKDTFIEFLKFTHGKWRFFLNFGLLSPILILYKAKIIPNSKAKLAVLSFFYRGWPKERLQKLGDRFAMELLPDIVYESALTRINWHLEQGHKVVIVSASVEIWFQAWCHALGLEFLSTELAFSDGLFTGAFERPNCYGEEKVKRIREKYDLSLFEKVYAYGDSQADQFMMSLAHESFFCPFS